MRIIPIIFMALLLAAAGLPQLAWTDGLTDADWAVLRKAVEGMKGTSEDPTLDVRIASALAAIDNKTFTDPRGVPWLGQALSRASKDPAACGLLRRIEPMAVCVK